MLAKNMEHILTLIAENAIVMFELMGVLVLIVAGVRGIVDYATKNPSIRLNLAKGMALGLEFKLGSEILRTVVVRDISELVTVGGIIVLRAALTFLIHWEIKIEEDQEEKEYHKSQHNSNQQ